MKMPHCWRRICGAMCHGCRCAVLRTGVLWNAGGSGDEENRMHCFSWRLDWSPWC